MTNVNKAANLPLSAEGVLAANTLFNACAAEVSTQNSLNALSP